MPVVCPAGSVFIPQWRCGMRESCCFAPQSELCELGELQRRHGRAICPRSARQIISGSREPDDASMSPPEFTKFTPPSSEVVIHTFRRGGRALLSPWERGRTPPSSFRLKPQLPPDDLSDPVRRDFPLELLTVPSAKACVLARWCSFPDTPIPNLERPSQQS